MQRGLFIPLLSVHIPPFLTVGFALWIGTPHPTPFNHEPSLAFAPSVLTLTVTLVLLYLLCGTLMTMLKREPRYALSR
jgi:hypothetical protein